MTQNNHVGDGKGNLMTYTEHVLQVDEWINGCPEQLERGMIVEIKRRYSCPDEIETVYWLVGDINEDGDYDTEGFYVYEHDFITRYRYTDIWKIIKEMNK